MPFKFNLRHYSVDAPPRATIFEHVEGCRFCHNLYAHFTLPNGGGLDKFNPVDPYSLKGAWFQQQTTLQVEFSRPPTACKRPVSTLEPIK